MKIKNTKGNAVQRYVFDNSVGSRFRYIGFGAGAHDSSGAGKSDGEGTGSGSGYGCGHGYGFGNGGGYGDGRNMFR